MSERTNGPNGAARARHDREPPGARGGPDDAGPPPSPGHEEVDTLLTRMKRGDRAAAAVFITRYGDRVRRRIRGKLNPAMRRVFDSQEILSTVGRRLDNYVRSGQLDADNVAQLWTLVFRMSENAVIDKGRIFRRLRQTEGEDSDFARNLERRLRDAEARTPSGLEIEVESALRGFTDSIDRQILSMWLVGTPLKEIAVVVDRTPEAVRQRWRGIRAELQRRYADAEGA